MKTLFNILLVIIKMIAITVFAAGVILTILGAYDFIHAMTHVTSEHGVGFIAIGLLKAVDMFLLAIVFFIFAFGILLLFRRTTDVLPVSLPEWLHAKDFIHLKVILWEAILTTLVVSYLAGLAERRLNGEDLHWIHLIIPGAILLISLSLFFLKKGEGKGH